MSGVDASAFLAGVPWTVLAVVVVLGTAFAVGVRAGKHAVVDVAWGLGFVAVALAAYLAAGAFDTRGTVMLVVVALWGVRLAAHIAARSRGQGEDPRYAEILERAAQQRQGHPQLHALRKIHLPQAGIMWVVSLPVQVAMVGTGAVGPLLWAGVALWAVGLFFEAVGDWQLTRFKADPANKGQVLDSGLWRYTRHPNYFGDAVAWWGIFLVAADVGLAGWLTLVAPLVMTWLLARGTGKPLLERDIAERRPDYAAYVRRTSGFVPLPPRRTA